jgi:solute carrier family 25 (mitochondrial S-adenosylmethionine transporter), member 26
VDLLFFPIDTVKTRLQSSQGFRRAGGLAGVYKGVGSVLVGSAPGGVFLPLTFLKNIMFLNLSSCGFFLDL